MRRILFFMLAFVAASVSVSCVDEVSDPSVFMQELTFSASYQSETKTALVAGNEVYWLPGDQIAVSGASDPFVTDIAEPSGFTQFTGAASSALEYYAVYPYASLKSWDGSTATVEIPQIQTAVKGTFADDLNISVASTSSEDMLFRFHNVLGYVKFTVSEQSGSIKSVTVSAIGNEQLAGDVQVDCSSDSPSASSVENSESYVTLTSEAVLEPGNYYIAMLPGTYASGLEFTFMNDKGLVATKKITRELTLSAGQIRNVGEMKGLEFEEVTIDPTQIPDNEIWYTTTDNSLFGDWSYYKDVCGDPFDKEIISHTYANGIGKIIFDGPLTIINDNAFSSYGNYTLAPKELTSIYLPNSVEYIGSGAFGNQKGIQTFMVPNSIIEIGGGAFMSTKIIEFIGENTLPNGEGILVDGVLYALSYDENEEELIIPSGVKEIGQSLMSTGLQDFCVRPNLKRLVISEGVEVINDNAFQYCLNLESVSLPSTLEEVGTYIFSSCTNIKEFIGNSKFITTDDKCFLDIIYVNGQVRYGIQSAVKVGLPNDYIIPEGIVTIRPRAFEGTDNLRSITLPNSIMIIESSGEIFRNCPNFEFIYGKYATSDNKSAIINNCLFCGNTNAMLAFAGKGIKEYIVSDGVNWLGDNLFSYQNDLENLVISDNVYYIGNNCFAYSSNLKSITLPANLESVRYDPFIGSNSLETIYFRSPTPPKFEVGGIEQNQYPNLTIYVPEQYLQAYLNDANWSSLHKYMKGYQCDDLYYISTDYSLDGGVKTLQSATKGDGIDIVLMGDAYSDRQIADGTYEADMNNLYNNLFTEEPYKSFKDHFNVYYVNVVSATEGYEYGHTALDGYFGNGTLVGGNDNQCFEYALNAITEDEMDEALIIVSMNSDAYAGTCYMYYPESATGTYGSGPAVAYFPKGGDQTTFAQLLHHEANGHGFAKLADEYAYEDMGAVPSDYVSQTRDQQNNWGWWKNVDFTSNPDQVCWSHFLEDDRYANEGLGVFEGGLTYWSGVWRPTEDSIMRYNTGGFNAPSREAIYYRIHKLAYGDSWEYDYVDFVEYDKVNRSTSASAPQKVHRNYVERPLEPTAPPVIVGKSWKDVK